MNYISQSNSPNQTNKRVANSTRPPTMKPASTSANIAKKTTSKRNMKSSNLSSRLERWIRDNECFLSLLTEITVSGVDITLLARKPEGLLATPLLQVQVTTFKQFLSILTLMKHRAALSE